MNIFYFFYRVLSVLLITIILFPFLMFVFFNGKYRKHLTERLGFISDECLNQLCVKPKIWIHAASLGEVKVADSIISALKKILPDCSVILSTITEHGRNLAVEMLGNQAQVIYAPIDLFLSVRKALHRINPDVLIFLETEIWPSWIIEAHMAGIRIVLLNGRISKRSLKRYRLFKPVLKNILSYFDILSMISEEHKRHIELIGADPEKVVVTGNAKYDMLIHKTVSGMHEEIRRLLDIGFDTPVIVAGSTRTGEEEIIIEAYKKIVEHFSESVLILAPRHIERVKDIIELLQKEGLKYHLRSEFRLPGTIRNHNILVIDSYGELFNFYSAADIAFCGASLVPLGGQNPLEPAAWGIPVFHGPYMDDFLDAMNLLKKYDASVEVTGPKDLAEKLVYYLNNPVLLREKGLSGKKALMENEGSSVRNANIIVQIIGSLSRSL